MNAGEQETRAGGETRLYEYWRSSASYRLRIALGLIGESFDSIAVDLTNGEQAAAANLSRNPQGLVPTLVIDGLSLTQSLAIIEYLDETRQAGFLPTDPAGRARARAIAYAIAMEIHPICNLRVAKGAISLSDGAITMERWMKHFIPPGLAAVERMLADGPSGRFCHGNTVTLADICLVPQIYNARRWKIDLSEMPRLAQISERLEALPAFSAARPREP